MVMDMVSLPKNGGISSFSFWDDAITPCFTLLLGLENQGQMLYDNWF